MPLDATCALMDSGGDRDRGNDHHAPTATPRHRLADRTPRMESELAHIL
jgi:hypothetical protein